MTLALSEAAVILAYINQRAKYKNWADRYESVYY
jgi:hypothetical protein